MATHIVIYYYRAVYLPRVFVCVSVHVVQGLELADR